MPINQIVEQLYYIWNFFSFYYIRIINYYIRTKEIHIAKQALQPVNVVYWDRVAQKW